MCGIVGYVGKRNAQNVLLDGLEKLEYRGYDSAGVALALDGGIRVVKSKGRLAELRKKLELQALAESGCGIGHTRWATHGEPSDVNSHPHSTPRVSIVHNGIIENYGILKERLIAKGYTFESETDTEVLVKLIDSYYEGEPLQAIHEALSMVRGSYALAVLFRDFPDTVFAVKRESPLIVGWGEGENFVASDIPALLKYTRRYSVLEEGDLAVVTREGIRFYNEFAEPVEREVLTADWDMEAAEKGGYPHFMLKEINEQPAAITATVSPRVEDGLPDLRITELSDEKLRDIGTIHLVACGTAMHAGMVGKAAIETLARVPAEVDIASEFRYRDPSRVRPATRWRPSSWQRAGACRCWPSSTWWAAPLPARQTMCSIPTPGRRLRWPPPRLTWCRCVCCTSLRCGWPMRAVLRPRPRPAA